MRFARPPNSFKAVPEGSRCEIRHRFAYTVVCFAVPRFDEFCGQNRGRLQAACPESVCKLIERGHI